VISGVSSCFTYASETGFAEINGHLPEADFWPVSLKVHPGYNFRIPRDPPGAWSDTSSNGT